MDAALQELALAHGVATWYEDWQQRRVEVDPDVVVAVLGKIGVDATRPKTIKAELRSARARSVLLPPTLVVRRGERPPKVPDGDLRAEDGGVRDVSGRLPPDLAPGWYRLTHRGGQCTVIVVPDRLAKPPRTWGWMLQIYGLRSACAGRLARGWPGNGRRCTTGSPSTRGCNACATSSSGRPPRRRRTCPSASCTTSRSGSTRAARTPGCCRTCWPTGYGSVPRRT